MAANGPPHGVQFSCGNTSASPASASAGDFDVRAVSACEQLNGAKRKHRRELMSRSTSRIEVTDAFRVPIDQTFRSARADHLSFIDSGSCGSPS
jgi:hypothetical protein